MVIVIEMVIVLNALTDKVFDAVEVAGKNVMSTSSVVTTGLVSQRYIYILSDYMLKLFRSLLIEFGLHYRYGEDAAKVTHDGLGAAGHAIGTAWAVFKIRKALNPKGVLKPTTLAKAAAEANAAKLKANKLK